MHPETKQSMHIMYKKIWIFFCVINIRFNKLFESIIWIYDFIYLVHLLQRRFDFFFCSFNARTIFMLIWCYFVQPCQQQGIFSHALDRNLKWNKIECSLFMAIINMSLDFSYRTNWYNTSKLSIIYNIYQLFHLLKYNM